MPAVTYTSGVLTNGPSFPGNDEKPYVFNEFVKLNDLPFRTKASAGTVGDITTGSLGLFFVSQNNVNTFQASVCARLRFQDE